MNNFNKKYMSNESLDFVDRLLRYDHAKRLVLSLSLSRSLSLSMIMMIDINKQIDATRGDGPFVFQTDPRISRTEKERNGASRSEEVRATNEGRGAEREEIERKTTGETR